MSDLSFKVPKRRKEVVTFTLEGSDHSYAFTPHKQADIFLPLMDGENDSGDNPFTQTRAIFSWLDAGLSESDRTHIEGRLRDEDDDLDFDTLGEVIKGLMEHVSKRPTT